MFPRVRAWWGKRRLKRMIEDWEATVCPGLRVGK